MRTDELLAPPTLRQRPFLRAVLFVVVVRAAEAIIEQIYKALA